MRFFSFFLRNKKASGPSNIELLQSLVQEQRITIEGLDRSLREANVRHDRELTKAKSDAEIVASAVKERLHPEKAWVEGAQVTALKMRVRELESDLSRMGVLRDALKKEKAYCFFLEGCLECENPSAVFNALPLNERQRYFDRVDQIVSPVSWFANTSIQVSGICHMPTTFPRCSG